MCGIAGALRLRDENIIRNMMDELAHRGPDDKGVYIDGDDEVMICHTRLSIIDLTDSGHQPMVYKGRYWIVYNGEIYNYLDLREKLIAIGYRFKSHSDTEVILASYMHWGRECLSRFRGMFSFAIWDRKEKVLFLARDRIGIKPLLYSDNNKCFAFASELKTLLRSGLVEPVVDQYALFDILNYGSVMQPKTIIKGVYHLEPGTSLTIYSDGRKEKNRYWNLLESTDGLRKEYSKKRFHELVEITRDKLEEACRYHLVSDVNIGSFLSGGIDSTAITAMMSRYVSYPIKSYSVGFNETTECIDELAYAKSAAERIGCDHTEVILTGRDIADGFDGLIEAIDQPSQDGTNTYFVSKAASGNVKVVLSGLGGDELFAGYSHFRLISETFNEKPNILDHIISKIHSIRPNRFTNRSYYRCLNTVGKIADLRRILRDSTLKDALSNNLGKLINSNYTENQIEAYHHNNLDILTQISYFECNLYLKNTLLRDNDVMSMAHSLEIRPMLLDHPLVEHAFALPPDAKIRGSMMKAALVESVKDILPKETINRKKMGFEMPFGTWLNNELKNRFLDSVNSDAANEIFAPKFLKKCEHDIGDYRHTRVLWTVFIFLEWYKKTGCTINE